VTVVFMQILLIVRTFFVVQIDRSVIMLMTDEQLKAYLPRYGDRLALRHFCTSGNAVVSGSNDNSDKKT